MYSLRCSTLSLILDNTLEHYLKPIALKSDCVLLHLLMQNSLLLPLHYNFSLLFGQTYLLYSRERKSTGYDHKGQNDAEGHFNHEDGCKL